MTDAHVTLQTSILHRESGKFDVKFEHDRTKHFEMPNSSSIPLNIHYIKINTDN